MVATSQPLASEVGLSILKRGGNAADAAVSFGAALNVTQSNSTGIGGDMFMLFYDAKAKEVKAINASGRCPVDLSVEKFKEASYDQEKRPDPAGQGWFLTVTGVAAGWFDAHKKFGSGNLSLLDVLTPAIDLAEKGHAVSQVTAHCWKDCEEKLIKFNNAKIYLVENEDGTFRTPREGEIFKLQDLAQTFRELVTHGKDGFYKCRIAQSIVDAVNKLEGGFMSLENLENHENTFDDRIRTNYRGFTIVEHALNGQSL